MDIIIHHKKIKLRKFTLKLVNLAKQKDKDKNISMKRPSINCPQSQNYNLAATIKGKLTNFMNLLAQEVRRQRRRKIRLADVLGIYAPRPRNRAGRCRRAEKQFR